MAFNPVEQYGAVRGFNFQPDWSSNGIGIWLQFDEARYRELIKRGKKLFPKMNTLRIWLSFNAWCENPKLYLKNVKKATEIIEQEGHQFIPVYLNGWFGVPSFGGFVPEMLFSSYKRNRFDDFRSFISQSTQAISSDKVLIHDISNEPFNCAWGREKHTGIVRDFLSEMCMEVRKVDGKPITVGSQGSPRSSMNLPDIKSKWGDI
ncbi:MAG: cellulase family glycosylhydrolase, partial [Bacillota bacterium]|nr:cellulase family glycosylhydrolase [Bacillota bacterium]